MYVVTQKTNIPTESQNIFLLENLRQFVEQNWCYNRVLSVGVPVENDDFECVNKTCEELVFAWKQTWRQLEKLPEIFICSSNNNSGKMMVTIDRIFENSRGFAKRGFAFPEEGMTLCTSIPKGNVNTFKGDNLVDIFCLTSGKWSTLKKIILSFDETPFKKELVCRQANRNSQMLYDL